MADYNLSKKALEDLSDIWNYGFDVWSEYQADKYYHILLDSCQELADEKITGKSYKEIGEDIFGLRIGQHIISYQKLGSNKLEIARILHSRMDLKNRMQE